MPEHPVRPALLDDELLDELRAAVDAGAPTLPMIDAGAAALCWRTVEEKLAELDLHPPLRRPGRAMRRPTLLHVRPSAGPPRHPAGGW